PTVDAPVAAGVGALARSLGATPAAVVLAALGTVLARLTGQADFVVGTPLAGRRPPGFEPLVGSLCDIAPLRLRPDLATSFAVAVRRTRDELLDALAHAGAGLALRPDDQPVPQRDETVLDGLGRRAAIGELGEIAAHWAGGWLGTGRTGRYRPDGTVEPAPVPVVRPAVSPEFAQGAGVRSR